MSARFKIVFLLSLLIFISACSSTPKINIIESMGMTMELNKSAKWNIAVATSSDGRYGLSAGGDKIRVWDLWEGKESKLLSSHWLYGGIWYAEFSPDGKYILVAGHDYSDSIKLWDVSTGNEVKRFIPPPRPFLLGMPPATHFAVFSPDGSKIVSYCAFGMELWDFKTGRVIRKFDGAHGMTVPTSIVFLSDGNHFITGHRSNMGTRGYAALWDVGTGSELKRFYYSHNISHENVNTVDISPDDKYVVGGGKNGAITVWDIESGEEVRAITAHSGFMGVTSAKFSSDGKNILSAGADQNMKLWDVSSGKEIRRFVGHSEGLLGYLKAVFTNDGKHILSSGTDSSVRFWDVSTGEETAMMVGFEDGEWLVITPNGYYNSSEKGDKYLRVSVGGKLNTISQLRESFYRPDLVKLALSGGSLKTYAKLSDIKQPPVVSIVDTPASVNKDEVSITLKIADSGGGVGDIRLYLNGAAVMLDSSRGMKVVPTSQNDIYKTYNLKLTKGLNSIRAIAFNGDNTMQSADALYQITASFQTDTKPSLYAVVIGINDYKNPRLQLNNAVADAALFGNTLRQAASGLFDKVNVKMLTTAEATTNENIIRELKAMRSLNPDDLFVFYVASHGTVDDGEYYLITSNVGSTRTEKLKTDAISQTIFKELIANIPATKKLIIIDTCNAGALGGAIQTAMLTRGMSEDTAMKVLSRAVGSTVLSASTSIQEALEGYNGHGLFTYVLTEGLQGKADKGRTGYVKTTDLADYVDNEVPILAEKIFKKAQYPTISISGMGFPVGKVQLK
jgi:WD40 repeat protein